MMDKSVLKKLEELMIKKNINPYQLAQLANFERGTILKWKKGTEPKVGTLEKVADALGTSVPRLYEYGEDIKVDAQTKEHVTLYEMLSEDNKKIIDLITESLVFSSKP